MGEGEYARDQLGGDEQYKSDSMTIYYLWWISQNLKDTGENLERVADDENDDDKKRDSCQPVPTC